MSKLLHPAWRRILRKAWSVRLIALAGVLSGLEFALPYLEAFVPVPHGLFAAVGSLVTGAALVARVVAQKEMADG